MKALSKTASNICVAIALTCLLSPTPLWGAIDVWLKFDSAWETNLDTAAANAGVASFSAVERGVIENNILTEVQAMYSNFNVNFVSGATNPFAGNREIVDFGALTATPGLLGSAQIDSFNVFTNQTANVFSHNFGLIIESAEARALQISEISTGLSGTAAHELGHSLGLEHQYAYGTSGVTPATYSNTNDLQNVHIMATGPTGLSEIQRETVRSFSDWSNLRLEYAGRTVFGGDKALDSSPLSVFDGLGAFDAGDTSATAADITSDFAASALTDMDAVMIFEDIDSTNTDTDFYSFSVTQASLLTAEVLSSGTFLSQMDSVLTLYGTDGSTVLFSNDDTHFTGNTFLGGAFRSRNSFFVNVSLPAAGTYYLKVNPFSAETIGDAYALTIGISPDLSIIPEPVTGILLSFLFFAGQAFARQRRRASAPLRQLAL